MKRLSIISSLTLLMLFPGIQAKTPKRLRNAGSSVIQVITFQNGTEKGRASGFITSDDGSCISDYTIFLGADSAVTISQDGKTRPVTYIAGANEMYETIRFLVKPDKKLRPLPVTQVKATRTETVSIIQFQGKGKKNPISAEISDITVIDGGKCYYTIELPFDSAYVGCPVVNEDGQCIGTVQSGRKNEKVTYVLDADFTRSINPDAPALLESSYTNLRIRRMLPATEDQALAYVYIMNQLSSKEYEKLLLQFMDQFPDSPDGMFNYGAFLISEQDSNPADRISEGEEYIRKAIDKADDKDRFHCDYASIIFENISASEGSLEENQSQLDKALAEVDQAIAIKKEPAYLRLKANILYAMKRYDEAYECSAAINSSEMATAETYLFSYEISRKLDNLDLSIELLDSVIAKSPAPYNQKVAALILERGNLKDDSGRFREAAIDYLTFESLSASSLPARFYFAKEQIEIKAKMYEQALADISRAREIEPESNDYKLEHASLHLRVGQLDQALEILLKLVKTIPEDPDVQRLTGIAYLRLGDKENACEHLSEARILGDEMVEQIIEQSCQ